MSKRKHLQPVIEGHVIRKPPVACPVALSASLQALVSSKVNLSQGVKIKSDMAPRTDMERIEAWLNVVLARASMVSESTKRRVESEASKSELSKLGLDRVSLSARGLMGEEIDRIYRAIYVYSNGFQEIMYSVLHHHEGNQLPSQLWVSESFKCGPVHHNMHISFLVVSILKSDGVHRSSTV
jgi:hypothetical protein